jgi:hypothetical protein
VVEFIVYGEICFDSRCQGQRVKRINRVLTVYGMNDVKLERDKRTGSWRTFPGNRPKNPLIVSPLLLMVVVVMVV